MYFNNCLSGPQQHTKVYADTFHSIFDRKISAKVFFEGFKKMTFRLDEVSRIEKDTFIGISSDPEGESILKKISQKDIETGNTSVPIYSNQCYIHYPYCPPRIVGFGSAYNYQLGNNNSGVTLNPTEFHDMSIPIKQIFSRNDFTVVLDTNGKLYYSGYKSSFSQTNYTLKKYHKKLPEETIDRLVVGGNSIILVTDDGKIYCEGSDYQYQFDSYSNEKYEFWNKPRPEQENESIVDINAGKNFHLYITDNNKLYGAGNAILDTLELRNETSSYTHIPLPENVTLKSVRCSESENHEQTALLFVEVDGKSELWSAGRDTNGLLGQGSEVNKSTKFEPLDYDKENITFKEAVIRTSHAFAITTKDELYGWGHNGSKELGMEDTKTYYSPTKIPYFEDYTVHSANIGQNHSIIKASPKGEPNKIMYFNLGNVVGIPEEGKTEAGILHLKDFDDSVIKIIETGNTNTIFVYDGEEKGSANVGVHEGYT